MKPDFGAATQQIVLGLSRHLLQTVIRVRTEPQWDSQTPASRLHQLATFAPGKR